MWGEKLETCERGFAPLVAPCGTFCSPMPRGVGRPDCLPPRAGRVIGSTDYLFHRARRKSPSIRPDCWSTMFSTATNFLARHAFVVMPKAVRKPSASPPPLQFNYPLPYGAVLRDGGVQ